MLIFIDNHSLDTARRGEVLDAVEKFLDTQKRPDDQMSIMVWNRSAKVVTPFTRSAAQLRDGIASLRTGVRSGISFPQEMERVRSLCQLEYDNAQREFGRTFGEAFEICRGAILAFSEEAYSSNRMLLEGLRSTVAYLAGLDGKKAVVFAGAHLPIAPGEELSFWAFRLFKPNLPGMVAATVVESPRTSVLLRLDDLAKEATASDVSLYFIDGGQKGDTTHSVEQAGPSSTNALETSMAANNTADAFKLLADVTGGVVVGRMMNFDVAFNTVAADLGAYYSLGFRPREGDGGKRIRVKMKDARYTARARTSYDPKTPDDEVTERVMANLMHRSVKGEWAIDLATGFAERDGKHFKVPMRISIPSTLTLIPEGDQLAGAYTVYVVMGNTSGGLSKVMKTPQTVRLPASEVASLRSRPLTFEGTLLVRPGDNILSVAVVDQLSRAAGYATANVAAQ
jgi:VWFA-related protein